MYSQTSALFDKTFWKEDVAVTSIECSMLGSMIAVVMVGPVGLEGQNNLLFWMVVQQCVSFADDQSGRCP